MNTGIALLAVTVPMVIFIVALALRLAASAQPETSWSAPRRYMLILLSYAFIGIGFVALLFTVFITGMLGGVMLMFFGLAAAQLIDVETKTAGKRLAAQQAEFLWILATTVRSGGDLAADLENYASGTWGIRHRRILALARRIREGTPLTEIVVPQGLLSRSAALEIQGGLQSGRLYEALQAAAERQTQELVEDSLSTKAQLAITYPGIVFTTCILVVGFLMYYIIPKFKRIFEDFGTELPQMTKILIEFSDFVINYGLLAISLLSLPILMAIVIGLSEFHGWRVISRVVFGMFFSRAHSADLLRYLAHAVSRGRPLNQALEALAATHISPLFQRRVSAMRFAIEEGQPPWQQLERNGFLKPSEVVLVESAEKVGNLPWTFHAIANSIERCWSYRLQALIEFVGPVVVVVVGFAIGFMAIAMFMPLIKLLNDLS